MLPRCFRYGRAGNCRPESEQREAAVSVADEYEEQRGVREELRRAAADPAVQARRDRRVHGLADEIFGLLGMGDGESHVPNAGGEVTDDVIRCGIANVCSAQPRSSSSTTTGLQKSTDES